MIKRNIDRALFREWNYHSQMVAILVSLSVVLRKTSVRDSRELRAPAHIIRIHRHFYRVRKQSRIRVYSRARAREGYMSIIQKSAFTRSRAEMCVTTIPRPLPCVYRADCYLHLYIYIYVYGASINLRDRDLSRVIGRARARHVVTIDFHLSTRASLKVAFTTLSIPEIAEAQ